MKRDASSSDSLRIVCGVPPASGITWPARTGDPVDRAVRSADVEGELALEHVVDLAGGVPVHDRRATAGRHPDQAGEERAAGLGAGGQHDDLVGAHGEPLGGLDVTR